MLLNFVHHYGSLSFRANRVDHHAVMQANERAYETKWRSATASRRRPPVRPSIALCMIARDEALPAATAGALRDTVAAARAPGIRLPVYNLAADGSVSSVHLGLRLFARSADHRFVGSFVRREQFLRVGGFLEWPAYEDWELWLRCQGDGARIVLCRNAVYRAHVRPANRNGQAGPARRVYDAIRTAHA